MIRLDPTRRAEAIEAGWRAYADELAEQETAFRQWCDGVLVIAVVAGSNVIGALFVDDGAVHLGIVPEWHRRWASRRLLRDMLSYGKRTDVLAGGSLAFVERIRKFEPAFSWQVREIPCQ